MSKKGWIASVVTALFLCLATYAGAWEQQGKIYGTEMGYEGLAVQRGGVQVRLHNASHDDVEVSLKLLFYDKNGNSVGYTIFGLREIPAGKYVDVTNNYLNGDWRKCRDAFRIEWQTMTYEYLY
jgi:hypothetical protein